jgi:cytochrome P450
MISRINIEKDNIGGYEWEAGTSFQMLYSAIVMHKDYWTEPEKFNPDRFYKVDESDKYILEKKKAKNALPMFGGGFRMCPGRKLALIELKCLIFQFIENMICDIELVDKNAP